ncbi:hypothetical protein L228DRAFT_284372 [Xylona heveae TC161]|uniref:Thioesterase/thiol ester dehydrase-isomerase n=1 Tax=Xylona heveae (strain CBS 132557 / TC161) TaxID=1328760 RepID=A0A165FSJ3_XYLHT|nr:hypothetical protein L228DRAFT_284372 [Xylona heveae TC161]KZF21323.1 hypothetical protein L228DRAFT_284372 [Xylona heveae TC161]
MALTALRRGQPLFQKLAFNSHGTTQQCMKSATGSKTYLSTNASPAVPSDDFSHLLTEMPARILPLMYDYLTPQPSHLLNVSLADFFPSSTQPGLSEPSYVHNAPVLPSIAKPLNLPPAHHLIYFPPQVPASQLLPDGTDTLHFPGEPFVRRLWTGGHVRFNHGHSSHAPGSSHSNNTPLLLDGHRAVCLEGIRDVTIKGQPGAEKVLVGIERRIARCGEPEHEPESAIRSRLWPADEAEMGDASIVERRNLVFMRAQSADEAAAAADAPGKIIRAPNKPTFTHTLRPTASLLFRFSALTFNAHAIHLSRSYTRAVEGHRNMLVHGPLTLVLLTTLLERHLASSSSSVVSTSKQKYAITDIQYRNVSPLYCDEELRLCGRESHSKPGRYELWAENKDGGLAVKGSATVEFLS